MEYAVNPDGEKRTTHCRETRARKGAHRAPSAGPARRQDAKKRKSENKSEGDGDPDIAHIELAFNHLPTGRSTSKPSKARARLNPRCRIRFSRLQFAAKQ